ncbi:Retrotransposon gag domain [Phytophthora cactorum]|nr:Retrotransposon gag domain [Phytophthora cactorum]
MQLFKPIPKRKADWPALANELQYPVNSVSTSQVAEDSVSLLLALGYENETYPSTMSLQTGPHEAGAALQKWKKKLRKAFGAIGINEGKQPVSRLATLEEDPPRFRFQRHPRGSSVLSTKRGADRDAFGTADASPYLQDSHMVTPRSTSRMRRMDAEDEGSRGRRGGARASRNGLGRRQTNTGASSSDDDDLLPPTYEDEDPQAELTRQMREIAALNDSDPTPRIEMASHDRWIVSSRSRAHATRWLRTFVYEMTGTHTEADKWCIPFELSLRDGAIHWFRQLPKKTKRTWKLLSNAFIRYYCSQFTQTALSRYYSAKRERSEHLCDYLNRLNGYARNARLQFEKAVPGDVGDDNMAESLYHTRVNDIHELEEIIEDVLKGKERMAKRDGVTRHSRSRDSRRDEPHDRQSRRDRQLEGREATRSGTERSDGEHHAHEDDQDEYDHYQSDDASSDGSLVDNDRHLAAANEGERRAAAEGTYARSDNRPPRGNIQIASEASIKPSQCERTFNQDRRGGERSFNQDRRGGDRSFGQDSRGRRDFNRDNRRPQYGPCAVCGGMSHSAHYCNKRCMFCKQAHDAGQCELFRNFQDLAKFVRIKGTKEELPLSSTPNCDWVGPYRAATVSRTFHGRRCIFAFMGNGKWPDDYITSVKATETEKERSQVLGGGVEDVMECADVDGSISEDSFGRVSSATSHAPKGHSKMMRLNLGRNRGGVGQERTRVLLVTGANVSVIIDTFAKKLRLRDVPDHGRRIDIQGINEGKVSKLDERR